LLVYYKKESGKRRIPYNDAVEEALCYGWIDSLTSRATKKVGFKDSLPEEESPLSEMNKEPYAGLLRPGR